MKSFPALTARGQLRRIRQLATAAMSRYDLPAAELHFVNHAENTTYRLETPAAPASPGPYVANRFLLRIHGANYNTPAQIESELIWLDALRHETDLAVPDPLRTRDGVFTFQLGDVASGGARSCSLLRWMRGAIHYRKPTIQQIEQLGRLMARLHDHARAWQPPANFSRARWDWTGLMANSGHYGVDSSVAWSMVPAEQRDDWLAVSEHLRTALAELGDSRETVGLIHADLHLGNVIYADGEARAIDFDDCGFAPWIYDLAVLLERWRLEDHWPVMRDALLRGYATIAPFPADQLAYLDLFIAARRVSLMLWVLGKSTHDAAFRDDLAGSVAWCQRMVKAYLTQDWTPPIMP